MQRRELDPRRHGASAPVRGIDADDVTVSAVRQDAAERRVQLVDREPDVEVHEVLADRLVHRQSPELTRARVPRLHAQSAVDHDRGREAREDRLEEGVGGVELRAALVELVVDRLELLVRRLELLVHRLELLVRRLQLLVRRLQLLDGRL